MICKLIRHESDCSCDSCKWESLLNNSIYFKDDDIIREIEDNPKPSQFSQKGRHTIYEVECEFNEDVTALIFKFNRFKIEIDADPSDPVGSSIFVGDSEMLEYLARNCERSYTVDACDKAALQQWHKDWSNVR